MRPVVVGFDGYPGNLTPLVLVTCIITAMGGLIFGYVFGISGGVTSMPTFLERFFPLVYRKQQENSLTNQYCHYNSETLTMFTSSQFLAALISPLVESWFNTKFGRKMSMLFGGVLFLIGALITGIAKVFWMLIVGRVLLGAGIGFAKQSMPQYLSEMAPDRYRRALSIGFELSISIGIFIANGLNYLVAKINGGWGWRLSLVGAMVPALIIVVGSAFLPDTPNSMIERGQHEEAREKLRKVRGINNVDEEFNEIVAASEASNQVEHPWSNLLKRKYRPHLTMAILIPFFQQFTGVNVIMLYAPVLFNTIGFGTDTSLMFAMITGLVNIFATLVSIYFVDKWGRRSLFLEGGTQMLICQAIVAACIGAKFGMNGNSGAFVVVIFICIYVTGFAWSWGPLGWLVPSEIFPLEIRSAAQSVNVSVNLTFTFLVTQVFLNMLCYLKFGLFIFFAFFIVVMSIFIYFFLPETKGIPIEEMGHLWRNHWFWSRYVGQDDFDGSIVGPPSV